MPKKGHNETFCFCFFVNLAYYRAIPTARDLYFFKNRQKAGSSSHSKRKKKSLFEESMPVLAPTADNQP
jgi:hypothetical protein